MSLYDLEPIAGCTESMHYLLVIEISTKVGTNNNSAFEQAIHRYTSGRYS